MKKKLLLLSVALLINTVSYPFTLGDAWHDFTHPKQDYENTKDGIERDINRGKNAVNNAQNALNNLENKIKQDINDYIAQITASFTAIQKDIKEVKKVKNKIQYTVASQHQKLTAAQNAITANRKALKTKNPATIAAALQKTQSAVNTATGAFSKRYFKPENRKDQETVTTFIQSCNSLNNLINSWSN